jgi:hypothetical protein
MHAIDYKTQRGNGGDRDDEGCDHHRLRPRHEQREDESNGCE